MENLKEDRIRTRFVKRSSLPSGEQVEANTERDLSAPLARHFALSGDAILTGDAPVRVKAISAFSLGGERDVAPGDEIVLRGVRARALVESGSVIYAEGRWQ